MTPENLTALVGRMSSSLAYHPITGEGMRGLESFGPHAFRHTAATHILRTGGKIEDAAASIGDSVRVTQEAYADVTATDDFHRVASYVQAARPNLPAIRRD
jgi:integrase